MRLIPRFSLRFLWIALTVFLIGFAVVVSYYQRYQAHERIAVQVLNQNGHIEEEPITLAGFVIGKRLIGVQVEPRLYAGTLELLETLPRPYEVRRFGCSEGIPNQEHMDRFLAAIGRFTELEELHLHELTLTQAQSQFLAKLPKLRILDLTHCNLPAGSLRHLASMPNLETLVLDETVCEPIELFELQLPRLRKISMYASALTQLELTKQGWGRFPLETLVLRQNKLNRINTKAGALPQLKHLDLGNMAADCQIDWKNLPAAMPELTLLAVPTPWLTAEVIPQLAAWTKLRYLYFDGNMVPRPESESTSAHDPFAPAPLATDPFATDPFAAAAPPSTAELSTATLTASALAAAVTTFSPLPSEPPIESKLTLLVGGCIMGHPSNSIRQFAPLDQAYNPELITAQIPAHLMPAIQELLQQRPDVLFNSDYEGVIQMLDPILQYGGVFQVPMWPSPNWRPYPRFQGGFF